MSGLTIINGPAGSGKTGRLVALAAQRAGADRFAPTLVLVPTARHGDQFRRRVVERCGVALNLEVTTIGLLARRVGDTTRVASVDVANELLRRATYEQIDDGGAARFAAIADTPGLHAMLARAVGELVSSDVSPPALDAAAQADGSADHAALAAVYGAYRRRLADGAMRDPREAPTLAAEAIEAGSGVQGLVLVDSFEFLNPRELALVAALVRRADVAVALDGRGSERARWTAERLAALVPGAALEELPPRMGDALVRARTAFDAETQLREIARAVKQALAADASLRPSDFAVTFRQAAPHLALARRVFAEYELPFDPAAGERLTARPFGAWVLQLLRLPAHDWRLTRVADLVRSGFLDSRAWGVERDTVDHALRVGRDNGLFVGLDALRALAPALRVDAGNREARGAAGLAGRRRAAADAIERVTAGLTTLLDGPSRTAGAWSATLDEALFGAGGLVPVTVEGYDGFDTEIAALRRDLDALRAVDEALGGPDISLDVFTRELEARMERPAMLLRDAGGVLFAPMHTLHGLRFAHVFAGGLAEGEFPAPRRTGTLLDGAGREALQQAGLDLPPEARATEDELWATVSSRAGVRLSAWRPRFDDGGRPRAASWYWHSAAAESGEAATDQPAAVPPEEAASLRELAVSLASRWREGERRRPRDLAAWPLVVRAAAPAEQLRRSFAGAGAHEGDLSGLIAPAAAERLTGESTVWSASRLEAYMTCSFQFFGRYALGLHEVEEEATEADASTRGIVVHDILDVALQPLLDDVLPLDSSTVEAAVTRMRERGRPLWDEAPAARHFGRAGLWRLRWNETADEMELLLRREAEENERLGVQRVAGLERSIAGQSLPGVDPPLALRGNIDRVDAGPGFVQIVDYKTGRVIDRKSVEEGKRLQLQLYAIAARELLGAERLVARYAYLRPQGKEWALDTASPADETLINAVAGQSAAIRDQVASGDFRVSPSVPVCPPWCDFRRVCRVNQFTRFKRWN